MAFVAHYYALSEKRDYPPTLEPGPTPIYDRPSTVVPVNVHHRLITDVLNSECVVIEAAVHDTPMLVERAGEPHRRVSVRHEMTAAELDQFIVHLQDVRQAMDTRRSTRHQEMDRRPKRHIA